MRPGAEVGVVALAVEADFFALARVLADQLHLVFLMLFLHQRDGGVLVQLEALERQVLLDDLLHLGLDAAQVLRRERARQVEVVVEPVLNRRADGEARVGEQVFDGLCHDVRGRMPVRLFALRVVEGENLQLAVLFHRRAQVDHFAVQLGSAGRAVKPRADGARDVGDRRAAFILPDVVFQSDFDHGIHSLKIQNCRNKKALPHANMG